MTKLDRVFLAAIFAIVVGTGFALGVAVHRLHLQEREMGIVEVTR